MSFEIVGEHRLRRFEQEVRALLESEIIPKWEKQRIKQKIALSRIAVDFRRPSWGLAFLTLLASLMAVFWMVSARVNPSRELAVNWSTGSMLILVFAYACAWWIDKAKGVQGRALSGVLVFMGLAIFGGVLAKEGSSPLAVLFVAVCFSYLLLALNVTAAYLVTASVRARVRG